MTSSSPDAAAGRTMPPARATANALAVPHNFDIRRTRRSKPAETRPALRPASSPVMDAETVVVRLEEAGHTLLCLPRTGPTTMLRQTRHQHVAEALEAYTSANNSAYRPRPPVPPAERITRMDQALAWVTLIPREKLVLRRIVGCRCLVSPLTDRHLFGWRQLARTLGADHKAIQRWHAIGIDLIVAALNREAAVAHSWDMLG